MATMNNRGDSGFINPMIRQSIPCSGGEMRNKNNLQGVRSIINRLSSGICRIIRDRKNISLVLVTALIIISVPLNGRYVNATDNTYSARNCQKQTSIRIIDESGGNALFPISNNSSEAPPFKKYVDTISKYVFDKIDGMIGLSSCGIEVDLFFVYRPLRLAEITPFNFKLTKAKNTRYLNSPWVKLSITNSPKLIIRAAFIWNERQFLFDQALMSGARISLSKPLLPLSQNLYERYGGDYEQSVILARSRESEVAAQVSIEKRVPADLLWGFRKGFQGKRGGTFPDYPVNETVNLVFSKYIDITKALLNDRFVSKQIEQRYPSVLDLKDIYNIDLYRVKELH